MSLVFSDTSGKSGIIQQIERNCGFQYGHVSSNTTRMAEFTADVNTTHDRVLSMIFEAGGDWQFDDSNHADHPIITRSLVSGQRDYLFTSDETGNLILDVYKVMIADEQGLFRELLPVNQQGNPLTGLPPANYSDGLNTGGQPNTYDKTGNAIFLDPVPNYSRAAALKVFISREGSYFTVSDTTKKPGIAGLFHEYYALRPSYLYCMRNQIGNWQQYGTEVARIEDAIRNYYKLREKDNPKRMTARITSSR